MTTDAVTIQEWMDHLVKMRDTPRQDRLIGTGFGRFFHLLGLRAYRFCNLNNRGIRHCFLCPVITFTPGKQKNRNHQQDKAAEHANCNSRRGRLYLT